MPSPKTWPWVVLVGLFVVAATWMGKLEASGPPSRELELDGGGPATFYLPGPEHQFLRPVPRPPGERPPVVVLVHGFSCNRRTVSSVARRIAQNGYAVISVELSGHGDNRVPFRRNWGRTDGSFGDVDAAVRFARGSPMVDGTRIALVGHSLGATIVLDYAARVPGIATTVMLDGGWNLTGPQQPSNALFLFAEDTPADVRETSIAITAHLAGVEEAQPSTTYGSIAEGTAVRYEEVTGVSHVSILWTEAASRQIIQWLDTVFAIPRQGELDLAETRTGPLWMSLALLPFLLFGLGKVVGALAPPVPRRPIAEERFGLLIIGGALLVTMPLLLVVLPARAIPVSVTEIDTSHRMLAGWGMIVWIALTGRFDARALLLDLRLLIPVMTGIAGMMVLVAPACHLLSTVVPTPEKVVASLLTLLMTLPYYLACEILLRRGGVLAATSLRVAGRLVSAAVTLLAIGLQLVPAVMILELPFLIGFFAVVEVVAMATYRRSGNYVVIALMESLWLGLVMTAGFPLHF